jgi:hypothetical protein
LVGRWRYWSQRGNGTWWSKAGNGPVNRSQLNFIFSFFFFDS